MQKTWEVSNSKSCPSYGEHNDKRTDTVNFRIMSAIFAINFTRWGAYTIRRKNDYVNAPIFLLAALLDKTLTRDVAIQLKEWGQDKCLVLSKRYNRHLDEFWDDPTMKKGLFGIFSNKIMWDQICSLAEPNQDLSHKNYDILRKEVKSQFDHFEWHNVRGEQLVKYAKNTQYSQRDQDFMTRQIRTNVNTLEACGVPASLYKTEADKPLVNYLTAVTRHSRMSSRKVQRPISKYAVALPNTGGPLHCALPDATKVDLDRIRKKLGLHYAARKQKIKKETNPIFIQDAMQTEKETVAAIRDGTQFPVLKPSTKPKRKSRKRKRVTTKSPTEVRILGLQTNQYSIARRIDKNGQHILNISLSEHTFAKPERTVGGGIKIPVKPKATKKKLKKRKTTAKRGSRDVDEL